ncbi:MAG TPA: glycosyltransferase family 39 protein [Pyrinomonadaceae bacterium]|nr:glycosyltransferase family 39 protein [Pyrinomonadaceae bacterium]
MQFFDSRFLQVGHREAHGLSRGAIVAACLSIVFIGVGVRLLHWQNNWVTIDNTLWRLTARYQEEAQFLIDGDLRSFVRGNTAQPDTGLLIHPPGYPIITALVHKLSGNSHTALRIFQIVYSAGAALLVLFMAIRLLPAGAAILAGLLVAFSPQLSFNSLLLLADSLAIVPILLAVYLTVRAHQQPSLVMITAAGLAIGISCWFRANGLLLAPFLCLLVLVLFERGKRWRYAGAMLAAALLVMAPITIRNLIVYRSFIPLSLGSGVTLVEGIADYDPDHKFELEAYDDAVCRQEAQLYNRPDYAIDLFRPDGIAREQDRRARGLAVIRSNKVWFMGVVLRRAASMLEYEQVSIVSSEPTITNRVEVKEGSNPVWSISPQEMIANNKASATGAQLSVVEGGQAFEVTGDDSKQGIQVVSAPIGIQHKSDYVMRVPVQIQQGRMIIKLENALNGRTLGSATIPDSLDPAGLTVDSMRVAQIPFVNDNADHIRVIVANAQTGPGRPIMQLGVVELFELGPASYLWTRYPRMLVKTIQKFFTTGWMLPLAALGVLLLALSRRWSVLAITLSVPAYYLFVHSPLHVEPRYVLGMHYFFLILVAVTLHWGATKFAQLVRSIRITRQA